MPANSALHRQRHEFDVCVVGGGMAGLCAAVSAARNGARTVLIHDRPVLGGNASSEVRMWIGGAGGLNSEAGLVEEIKLDNAYYNTSLNYSVWDSVLWAKAHFQPNLTLLLNCSCVNAQMTDDGPEACIESVEAWQGTTQTVFSITAELFIDCSGDSILAALTPAEWRAGREACSEFDEDIQPDVADEKTMGNSLLIQLRRTDEEHPFVAPPWAYKFTSPEDLPHRIHGMNPHNFWWIEVGGLRDTIKDAEAIRDELMKVTYGTWDYLKNYAPERDKSKNWAIEWIGSLPGKRENRRYIGDHVLTQNDVRAEGKFDDVVAYGGWSMDDHHPAGIYYPGEPTIFHAAPSPYGIPYRCLYSRNVPNLLFAGRNISVTHAALSSTRVMATCAVIGQAAGTAAALCIRHNCRPRALSSGERLRELQSTLMDDDCWLPGITRPVGDLARGAKLDGEGGNIAALHNGLDRDRKDEDHAWSGKLGQSIEYRWKHEVEVAGARLVFDSNLRNEKPMPHSYPQRPSVRVPDSLVKAFRLEALNSHGHWETVGQWEGNFQRLVQVPLSLRTTGLRLVPEATWGAPEARVFAFEPLAVFVNKIPVIASGPPFSEVRAAIPPADLEPPQNELEVDRRGKRTA